MNLIPLSSITIPPNRQRQEFGPSSHQELITSLSSPPGLLHPPVLRKGPDGEFILVAGERRLRALKEMAEIGALLQFEGKLVPPGMVPYTNLGDLTDLEAREAELEENVRRVDLTWQERAEAEASLLALREDQAQAKGLPRPGLAAIALESRGAATPSAIQGINQSRILSANLHRPEVKNAKSAAEAMKALLRVEEGERNREKATLLGKDFLGGKHRVFNWDCLEWMAQQPDGEYDVILTDPPYGMGADEFGDSGGGAPGGSHFYADDVSTWRDLMNSAIPQMSRLTKPNAHLYLFCDLDNFSELRYLVKELGGWKPFRTPLLWFKPFAFRAPWPEHGPQRKYECILYARKGELKCTKLAGDVLTYPSDDNLGHQAQKPVALYQDLLSRSVRPGMKVLDPFCGTGPVFPAAHALSAIATGVEQDPAAYSIAAGRLLKLKEGK